jgi:hypothetical protein
MMDGDEPGSNKVCNQQVLIMFSSALMQLTGQLMKACQAAPARVATAARHTFMVWHLLLRT